MKSHIPIPVVVVLLAMALSIVSGCQNINTTNPNPVVAEVPREPWPESEYAALPITGTNTVQGQAFLKTRGGDVKVAAGSTIVLSPVTSYSKQFVDVVILNKNGSLCELDPKDADPKIWIYAKQTIGDGDGRFKFYDVPAGQYYLYTTVTWEAPTEFGLLKQGGWILKTITVVDGERNEFILTR